MSYSSIARRTCSRQWCRKQSRQNAALWRRMSMTAGWRQRRHFMSALALSVGSRAARDDRADLDDVGVGEAGVLRDQRVALDHQDGLRVDLEPGEQLGDRHRTGDLDLAPRVAEQDLHSVPDYRPRRIPRISKISPGFTSNCRRVRCRFDITRRTTRSVVVAIVK